MTNIDYKYHYTYVIICTNGSFKGKFYFGQHSTNNLDDGYLGSGRKIGRYLNKYPNDYIKYIIGFYNDQESLNEAEYKLIKPWLGHHMCLNLKDGGNKGIFTEEYRQTLSIAHKNSSPEIKEKQRQCSIQNITSYNKSEKHKQDIIKGNSERWKNGLPEQVRINMKQAQRKFWDNKGKVIWVHNSLCSKMIKIDELDDYLLQGYSKGRGGNCTWNTQRKGRIPWNKGLKISK